MSISLRKKSNLCFFTILFFILSSAFFSCSIDYSVPSAGESDKPEFMFRDVSFSRLEDGVEKVVLYAGGIELYKNEDAMYGSDLSFLVYDDSGDVSVSGTCGLFSVDTTQEEYIFYDDVSITSYEQDLRVEADNIRWNGKTEQLVSAGVAPVRLYSGGYGSSDSSSVSAELEGMGFSADGSDLSYVFSEGVSGVIYTDESGGGR